MEDSENSSQWRESEIGDLIDIWGNESVQAKLEGTYRNRAVFEVISKEMTKRGHRRTWLQCQRKVKSLKSKFKEAKVSNHRSGQGRATCPFYDQLERILGYQPSVSPMEILDSSCMEEERDTEGRDLEECNRSFADESPQSPQTPPNKSAKKVSRGEQMIKDIKEFFTEMDRDFEERERLRLMEQRQHEECLRKEAKEEEREERARQMAMFKELLESQNSLLRELLQRLPSPVSQQLTSSENNGETETTSSVENVSENNECTKCIPNNHAESPHLLNKVSQEEQLAKDMKECFAEIARTLEERERLRLVEQRQHEERLRKEAKEEAREERARQMAMFKEMQESQNGLLKELLRHMPSPTLQQLNSSKYWHSGSQSRFSTDTANNSNMQNTSEQDMIFNPLSSQSFMEQ